MEGQYTLTEDGAMALVDVLNEFFHGFTFDEIAENHEILDKETIGLLFYTLFAQAGLVEPLNLGE